MQINKPGPNEVLIRTAAAGVCHSDLHFIEGSYPAQVPVVLGHEIGRHRRAGRQRGAHLCQAGRSRHHLPVGVLRPLRALYDWAGTCHAGGRDSPRRCRRARIPATPPPRITQDGKPINQFLNLSSFAEQMLVHQHAVVAVRKDMPLDRAALIGCGVTTGVGAVIHTSNVQRPGETVAVIGCGGVGLAAINGAAIAGAGRIIAIDVNTAPSSTSPLSISARPMS